MTTKPQLIHAMSGKKGVVFGVNNSPESMLIRRQMTHILRGIPQEDTIVGVELPDSYRKQDKLGFYFGGLKLFAHILEENRLFKGMKVAPLFTDELYITHVRILIAQTIIQRGEVDGFRQSVTQVMQMPPEELAGRESLVTNDVSVLRILDETDDGKNIEKKIETESEKRFEMMLGRIREQALGFAVTTLNYSTRLSKDLGYEHVDVPSILRN